MNFQGDDSNKIIEYKRFYYYYYDNTRSNDKMIIPYG